MVNVLEEWIPKRRPFIFIMWAKELNAKDS
jgi:hypothetical protein